jgi:hypothetical protein
MPKAFLASLADIVVIGALPLAGRVHNGYFSEASQRDLHAYFLQSSFVGARFPEVSFPFESGSVLSAVSSIGLSGKREAPTLTLQPPRGALGTVAFPTPVNATTDETNDDMKPTKFTNEAELKALFDHAVRAIGFYEAQRKEALMALESLRRALNNRHPKPPTP